jgi:hypothetical protein
MLDPTTIVGANGSWKLSTHQFYPDAQSGGSGNPNVTILTMRRSPLVNQDKRPRLRFLG